VCFHRSVALLITLAVGVLVVPVPQTDIREVLSDLLFPA
jgi:hypothetical protein